MSDEDRARALPFLKAGEEEYFSSKQVSDVGFVAILRIFIRIWPYLLPQIVGIWREFRLASIVRQAQDANSARADVKVQPNWHAYQVPVVCSLLVVLSPLLGWIQLRDELYIDFVWSLQLATAVLGWLLFFNEEALKREVHISVVLTSFVAFFVSLFLVEGQSDNLFSIAFGLLCVSCFFLQFSRTLEHWICRVRTSSHLFYYFMLLLTTTLITMLLALFSVDLISQSILQAEPLTPFLADFLGEPELAGNPTDVINSQLAQSQNANVELQPLTDEQRHSLTWAYGILMVFVWIAQIPTLMLLPYYYIFIMQRINQELRMALLERWHRLSLRYHSDHRVGDSVYRLYQDSAQVTAVVGTVMQVLQLLIAYATAVLVLFALDPILGFMTLSIVLLAMCWGYWYSPRMRMRSLTSRIANSAFTSRVQEVFSAVRHIKALGTGPLEQQRLERDSVSAFNASYRVRSLVAVVGIVMFTLAAGALLIGQFLTAVWAFGERETFAAVLVGFVGLSFVRWIFVRIQHGSRATWFIQCRHPRHR